MSHPRDLRGIELTVGKIEMVNSLFFKFREKAIPLLELKYKKELEKITQFYKRKE